MRKKKRRPLVLLMAVLLLASAGWAWSIWLRVHDDPSPPDNYTPPDIADSQKKITNILVLGIDQLGNDIGRADSIMVMSINEDTDEVAIISFPRDSRVDIPGHGMDKINHAMAYKGGVALMKSTVEQLLGVPIDHYVYTNFTGFMEIVDILGGVTINVERDMVHQTVYSPPINLSKGVQVLNGVEALGYVRFRSDSKGDFGRMERQQVFLKAVAKEVLQVGTVFKLPRLLEQTARYIRTDMSIPQLLSFARRATDFDTDNVATVALPGRNANIDGVSYVILDEEVLQDTIQRYLRWEPAEEEELQEQ